jgi:hypothetical protein
LPSTAIKTFSYDLETRTLFVTFIDGDLYAYRGVEAETYQAMRAVVSKGRFFARHVRGRYAYAKLDGGGEGVVFTPPDGTGFAAGR